jgi:hypothetical protein
MNELVNECVSEEEEPPNRPRWVYIILGIREPHGLPPRSSITDILH